MPPQGVEVARRREPKDPSGRRQYSGLPDRRPCDLIVLVYVVESIADSDLVRHVERLLDLRKPGGLVVGVTYLDRCALDAFSSAVQRVIPYGRTDAISRVFPRLRAGGLNVHNLDVVRSEFRASSVDELFDVLSFFYEQELLPTGVFAPPFRESFSSTSNLTAKVSVSWLRTSCTRSSRWRSHYGMARGCAMRRRRPRQAVG